MKDRSRDPRALDVPALCRSAGDIAGEWPLASLQRLSQAFADAPPAGAEVAWSAHGSQVAAAGSEPQLWLALHAAATVPLQCQRCLQPLSEALVVDRRVRFVAGEDEAARLDEDSDDDVLALPPRLDLQALLEDELILALPLVPRHAVCPEPLLLRDDDEPAAAESPGNPFAALAALRGGRAGGKDGGKGSGKDGGKDGDEDGL